MLSLITVFFYGPQRNRHNEVDLYCKVSKFLHARKLCCNQPKIKTNRPNNSKMPPRYADSADLGQISPLGLHCLPGLSVQKLKKTTIIYIVNLSLVMRKPAFCICENKDADQLRGNREADQRLCFRYTDSTFPLLPKSEILSL